MRGQTYLFAYGTLRPGCGNDRMLGHYVHVGRARRRGRLHYHECGHYPVLVPGALDLDDWVYGDVLLVNDNDLTDVLRMEVLAGYDAEWWRDTWVNVGGSQGYTAWDRVEALTFPWRRPHYGERIDSGDWTSTPHGLITPKENA